MGIKRREQRESFIARDAEGNEYEIEVWADILDAGDFEDPDDELEGLRELTCEGMHVNRLGKGRYQMLTMDDPIDLTSDDPNAP